MTQDIPIYDTFDAANADSVIVTFFRCERDDVRGWYMGPPSFSPDVPMSWDTSPKDMLLGPIALVRAMEIASKLRVSLSIVDPDGLWDELHGKAQSTG